MGAVDHRTEDQVPPGDDARVRTGLDLGTDDEGAASAFKIELAAGFQYRGLVADLAVDPGGDRTTAAGGGAYIVVSVSPLLRV